MCINFDAPSPLRYHATQPNTGQAIANRLLEPYPETTLFSPDLPPLLIAWCTFALFCGGLIKGSLGAGTPLLTVPLMALVLPAQAAISLMAIPVVAANLWQASNAPDLRGIIGRFWPVALAMLAGTYVGLVILSKINEQTLLMIVGSFVIALTFLQISAWKLSISKNHTGIAGPGFGFISGPIGGISSMFGPLLILYPVSLRALSKDDFISAISLLYLCALLPWTAGLIATGLLTKQLLLASALATIPLLIGLAIGQQIRKRVSDKHFQHLITAVLLTSGVSMLWQAAT